MHRPILITAGATRNPIDSMRSITAHSSGATGVYIAHKLESEGRQCTLMGSNIALMQPKCPHEQIEFTSTRDLLDKMKAWTLQHPTGIIIHAAAVGDFEVRNSTDGKIASGSTLKLELYPTPKIVDAIKSWSLETTLISFKAAAPNTPLEQVEQIALKQLHRTQSDLVFANVLGNLQENVLVISNSKAEWFTQRSDGIDALIHFVLQW